MKKVFERALMIAVLFGSMVAFASCNDKEDAPGPVVVFDPDNALYSGETKTTCVMGVMSDEFRTDATKWNVIIESARGKATVKILNVKFNSMMPFQKLMVLEGLSYNATTNTVSGTNIIPKTEEGGSLVSNENYPFTSITVKFPDKTRQSARIDFTVQNDKFTGTGSFYGNYTLTE